MANRTCSVDGCTRGLWAKGFCPRHYRRWHTTGNPIRPCLGCGSDLPGNRKYCSDDCLPPCPCEGCTRPGVYAGYCYGHYAKKARTGEASALAYTVTDEWLCVVCGAEVEKGSGRRRHCSNNCQAQDSRHKGKRPKTATCVLCRKDFTLMRGPGGRFQRTDTRFCPECGRDSPEAFRFRRYGITPEQYGAALAAGCEICHRKVDTLHVDHDHNCCSARKFKLCGNCTRGLLCGACNRALGMFRDDPDVMRRAIEYLAR